MFQEQYLHLHDECVTQSIDHNPVKSRLDLLVLRYMAFKLRLAVRLHGQATSLHQTQLYYADEHHQRMHRIALYDFAQLRQEKNLVFVGFVSKKRQPLSSSVNNSIYEVDKKLVVDLVNATGLLSYSSLELRSGNWYNLVVFSDLAAKSHIQSSETHKYAAYQVAPLYYEWIRLHSGIMQGGLVKGQLILQRTKYYLFQGTALQTAMSERTYTLSLPLQGYEPEHCLPIRPIAL